ncbi:MAG: NAD(P)(+) transhydrogenase (Re/Si-specific) subunit beta, partial [Firmicutes bacterium]|nr:NAD(P)(+) transhydrogenase (Re/Si-specific) subunit beta [Bacillota bacterium]
MSTLSWILQIIFIAGVIYGIRLLNSPETAVKGNFVNALSMAGAIIVTMVEAKVLSMPVIWAGLIVGSALGVWMSVKVLMIQMPQMVALLNGLGGGASATVALMTIYMAAHIGLVPFTWFTSGLAVIVGGVTLSGSLVAAAKLHGKMNQRPVHLPMHNAQLFASLAVMALSTLGLTFNVGHPMLHAVIITVLSLYFGYVFTVRVGGADMPITISLLNSFSGVAGAIAGFALENGALLVVVGSIVGASGLILTQIMCRAMNTTLMSILLGKTTAATKKTKSTSKPEPKPEPKAETPRAPAGPSWEDAIRSAKKVVIIPGYGMALAQAQLQVKQLGDLLASQGKEVRFGIHPVAGRMPGHMNVLLAEVDVPYDQLYELDDINAFLADADVSIIIGANDVVNPAAIELEGTPIYGMPIIRADHAKQVLVCNFDTKPGYAGVDNSLYEMDKVELLLGDAKDS